jgi:hypothetical protein
MKTYALADERGRLTLRGSALRSRGLEPFVRQLIEEIVRLLLVGRATDVKGVVDRWRDDFAGHRVPVRLFARTETLQDALDVYRDRVRDGLPPPAQLTMVALASGRTLLPAIRSRTTWPDAGRIHAVAESAKLASLWNPEQPDENTDYYQAKV